LRCRPEQKIMYDHIEDKEKKKRKEEEAKKM
jgi:hypothetical protein